jgi:NAD+ synthase (glutamine-hydrolysing)
MKIALSQLNYHIGNYFENTTRIAFEIKRAQQFKVDLIIFSELAVCGYPPLDLLEHKSFIEKCDKAVQQLAKISTNIGVIIGAPSINPDQSGKNLYNSAYFLSNGKVQDVIHKGLLPTYDIFDEYRYFEPNKNFKIVEFKGKRIAITICEDLWDDQPALDSFGRTRLYRISPMQELSKLSPDFIVNIAASPFSYQKQESKKEIFINKAAKYSLPLFYVNQVGGQTELIFEGNSLVLNRKGEIVMELNRFEEDYKYVELEDIDSMPALPVLKYDEVAYIYDALILGIRDYFGKLELQTAIVGLSGGIDSAVTLVLAAKALGSSNLKALLMPSVYSSEHSVFDAEELARRLDVEYEIVSIESLVEAFEAVLLPLFENLPSDITEENIQARIRGTLLMAFSNKFGNILLNTSNKSEAAVGYGTLYGDMAGGLSVLGDVYKTDVFRLARYINKDEEIIPQNILDKPPSAELRPNQKDSDSLPEYEVLDKILFEYIENFHSIEEIAALGFDEDVVQEILKKVNQNEYKRYQTPPILRISSKAFGPGRRMPLVAKYG